MAVLELTPVYRLREPTLVDATNFRKSLNAFFFEVVDYLATKKGIINSLLNNCLCQLNCLPYCMQVSYDLLRQQSMNI